MPPGAWRALLLLALIVGLGLWAARLPAAALARRVVQTLPFFLLPALALPVSVPGRTALQVGPLALSEPGLVRAADVVLRATLAVSAVAIVISVTRAADLLRALDRLPVPDLIKSSLALGYRYVYLLNDESERTARAIRSRMGRSSRSRYWRVRATSLAHLLVRAHERAARIHAAMSSRGYRDRMPTLRPEAVNPAWTLAIVGILTLVWLGGLWETLR